MVWGPRFANLLPSVSGWRCDAHHSMLVHILHFLLSTPRRKAFSNSAYCFNTCWIIKLLMQGNPLKILSLVSFISQMSNQLLWERMLSAQGHSANRKSNLQLMTSVCSFFHRKHLWTFLFASDMVEFHKLCR